MHRLEKIHQERSQDPLYRERVGEKWVRGKYYPQWIFLADLHGHLYWVVEFAKMPALLP